MSFLKDWPQEFVNIAKIFISKLREVKFGTLIEQIKKYFIRVKISIIFIENESLKENWIYEKKLFFKISRSIFIESLPNFFEHAVNIGKNPCINSFFLISKNKT